MQALHRSSRHALQALLRPASANHTPAPTQSAHLLNRSSGGTRQSSVSPFVRGHALRRSLCHPSGLQPPLAGPDQFVVFRLRAAAVGLGSGALGACAGIGGAVFIVPGLMRYCALAQPAAAATSMAAVCAVSTTCAVAHSTADGVQWETAALMAAAAALATPLGATLAPKLDPNKLRALFGGFLVLLAPIMPLRSYLMSRQSVSDNAAFVNAGSAPPYDGLLARNESVVVVGDRYMAKHFVIALGGLGIGFGSGLLGVGGGSLMTPLIACLHPELPLTAVLGTSFAAMSVPAVVAAASYYRMGLTNTRLVPGLVGGAILGAAVGSRIAVSLPDEALRWAFAFVFFVLGLRTLRVSIKPRVRAGPASPAQTVTQGRKEMH